MRQVHRKFLTVCLVLGAAAGSISPRHAGAAGDRNFFGSYCGSHRESETIVAWPCPAFPWLIPCPVPVHVDFSVSARADYRETSSGDGLIHGAGRAEVVGGVPEPFRDYLAPGDAVPFVFSGAVTAPRHARGFTLAPGSEPTEGSVDLSGDGLEIKLRGLDRVVTLSKENCGNEEPEVTISGPDNADFGEVIDFTATFNDDQAPPGDEFLRWESDRDGWLGNGLTLWTNSLGSGRHLLTFSAWDAGGLPASATHEVVIENEPPSDVSIHSPEETGAYYEGVVIAFRGSARDRPDGNLTGESLRWTYGPEDREIGTGSPLADFLPAGNHDVRLTAFDSADASTTASVRITVGPPCAPDCPPSVIIDTPKHNEAWLSHPSQTCVEDCELACTLEARVARDCTTPACSEEIQKCKVKCPDKCKQCTVLKTDIRPGGTWDAEDGASIADGIVWTALRRGFPEGDRILLGRGATLEVCPEQFSLSGLEAYFTIRAEATDSNGNKASDEIGTLVMGAPLI